jgi:hypothetical protein
MRIAVLCPAYHFLQLYRWFVKAAIVYFSRWPAGSQQREMFTVARLAARVGLYPNNSKEKQIQWLKSVRQQLRCAAIR